ncbi:paraquat-inducible protein A [Piscinibacter sp.]|jgi:paraquat-inducible protein A|uniref:paraquat-inducible protein A n=1 Tax=Piscinibacter sp. TaxID=1903157 RepID=UPI003559D6DE
MARFRPDFVVCQQCGAVHRWRPLHSDDVARCTCCAAVLARGHRLGVDALLALTLAALAVWLIANLAPIVSIELRGNHAETTLAGAISTAWQQGERVVAVLAAVTAVIAPALLIALRLLVLLPLALRRTPRHFAWCLRALHEASQWNMAEVLMVAALVSIVRVAGLAQAQPGPGMLAFGALALLLAALESAGLKHLWWTA